MRRLPAEFGSGLGGVGALVEQEDFGEGVAQAAPGLRVRAGDGSWRASGDSGRLGQFATVEFYPLPTT